MTLMGYDVVFLHIRLGYVSVDAAAALLVQASWSDKWIDTICSMLPDHPSSPSAYTKINVEHFNESVNID